MDVLACTPQPSHGQPPLFTSEEKFIKNNHPNVYFFNCGCLELGDKWRQKIAIDIDKFSMIMEDMPTFA